MTRRRPGWLAGTAAAIGIGVAAALVWLRIGPLPDGVLDFGNAESTVIVDRNGEVLYEARADGGARTSLLRADALPATLVAATIAAEDRRFWSHHGVDPLATGRAIGRNVRRRYFSEGGSTITQQVAKLLLARGTGAPPAARGLRVKVREAVLALRLEHRFDKRAIMALYLNLAPYGNQLVGAERASHAYFGCDAALLTPAQAAFLAALPQRPTRFNPYRDPERVRPRQRYVIDRMQASGALTPDAAREALAERMALRHDPPVFLAPHFVQRVIGGAGGLGRQPDRGTRIVTTTLDAELQREVTGIIRSQRATLDRYGAHNVAAVVLDNVTGEWLAWEGSGDYNDAAHGGAIDGVVTPRQPGSALKPFTYALAFEEGETPATVLPDIPSFFPTAQPGVLYSPRNYDGQFRGPLLARRALAGSENVPAVAMASRVGVPNLLRFLRSNGFTTFDKTAAYYGLGVTLGDAEVRLDELVAAYSSFARGGVYLAPTMVRTADRAVRLRQGDGEAGGERIMAARTAFWISDILDDDDARAFAFGRGGSLEFPFEVAAKTGTSQAYRDNWAIGYTRAVTVGVWVGNFDRTPLVNSSGVTGAGPIFHAIMLAAEQRVAGGLPQLGEPPTEARADAVERRAICALSGMPAGPWCPAQVDEWMPGAADGAVCSWHTGPGAVRWPPEYRHWAQSQRLLASDLPKKGPYPFSALAVINPPPGAVYLIDPTLRPAFQTLALRASTPDRGRIEWRVDGERVGSCDADAAIDWPLVPGAHTVSARDALGHQADSLILVK